MAHMGGEPPSIDATVPHSARIWNYWLGGKDNFAIDRIVGDQVREAFPGIVAVARAQRAFLVRAVTYLAGEARVRQFLDVGTGLPTAENTHEVAQRIAPDARVVYVDNDPVVLTHARALLTSSPQGVTAFVDGDLRDPDAILRRATPTLDFSQPVALLLLGILGHMDSHDAAKAIVGKLVAGLGGGSYLVIADGTSTDPVGVEAQARYNERSPVRYHLRSPEQIAAYFEGLELVDPGITSSPRWRPDHADAAEELPAYCGVARKP